MSNNITIVKSDKDVGVTKQTSTVTVNKNTVPAGFTNFTAAGDSGNSQITEGETLTLTGGTGITTSVSGDTVTFSVTDAEVLLQNEDINGGQF
tara:strand:+ start:3655 stop:3933 length:279 start_codon:yes stop_codon:yes gene_type:complete